MGLSDAQVPKWDLSQSRIQQSKCVQVTEMDLVESEKSASKTLKEKLRSLWRGYQSTASIHGVGFLGDSPLHSRRQKRLWTILIITMSTLLIIDFRNHLDDLIGYKLKTKLLVKYKPHLHFPSVTICNLNELQPDKLPDNPVVSEIFHLYSFSPNLYAAGKNIYKLSVERAAIQDVPGAELQEMYKNSSQSLDSMLRVCQWKGVTKKCGDLFTQTVTGIGRCYTFNGITSKDILRSSRTRLTEGLKVLVDIDQKKVSLSSTFSTGIKVIVGEPKEVPFPEFEGWNIRPGVAASIALSRQEIINLPDPYKAFEDQTCRDMTIPNSLKRYPYKYIACMYECVLDQLIELCNCTHFLDPSSFNGTGPRVCSAHELLSCYLPNVLKVKETSITN